MFSKRDRASRRLYYLSIFQSIYLQLREIATYLFCIDVYICAHTHTYMYTHIYMYVCMCVLAHIYVYICIHVYIHMHTHIYMYTHIYTYTQLSLNNRGVRGANLNYPFTDEHLHITFDSPVVPWYPQDFVLRPCIWFSIWGWLKPRMWNEGIWRV